MIRMELDFSIIVRVVILTIGFTVALYRTYNLTLDKRVFVSIFVILITMYLMTQSTYYIMIKVLIYFLVSFMILTSFYHIKPQQSVMFSYVLLFMVSFSDTVSLQIMARTPFVLNAVINQTHDFAGFMAVFVPSFTVLVFYIIGSEILRKAIDVYRERLAYVYVVSSFFNLLLIYMVSVVIVYTLNNLIAGDTLYDIYNLISFAYIGVFFLPIIVLFLLRKIYLFDLEYERLENEMVEINDMRVNAHRYSHNLNNIVLSIHQLAKEKNEEGIHEYLNKL